MAKPIDQAWKDFPALTQKIEGRGFSYLDSAATTLKPWPVIERVSRFLSFETANVHRGAYRLSNKATEAYERSRELVRQFIKAQLTHEVVLTKGTTEGVNLIASSLSQFYIQKGDAVVVSELDHHSNWVPWQMVCQKLGAHFLVLKTDAQGALDYSQLENWLSTYPVKVVALTALSNALGVMTDLKRVKQILTSSPQTLFLVDAAQAISFIDLDVTQIGCDFLVFSGHKLFGPYGVGVAYLNQKIVSHMPPYQGGGSMVDRVTESETTYLDNPHRFEAGTPNIEGVIGLGAAIEYFNQWTHADIQAHEQNLYQLAYSQLKEIKSVRIFGDVENKGPILSFLVEGAHPFDVAHLLNEENVFVRAGHHCCQPLMSRLGVTGTVRASFSIYNRPSDVERFIQALKKVEKVLL
jgi:cysteine desulfurase/selenocysteine lyase